MIGLLRGRHGAYDIHWWHERRDGEAYLDLRDLVRARAFARSLTSSETVFRSLRTFLEKGAPAIHRLDDESALDLFARLLSVGRVYIVRRDAPVLHPRTIVEEESAPPPAEGKTVKEKTWISIQLLDTDDNPIPGEPYWIQLPDGTIREGRLDARGRAYFDDLDPGQAEVRWPRLDEEAVQDSAGRTARRPEAGGPKGAWGEAESRTWIAIELFDMDGQPVAGERYRVKLTDGTLREGRLNARGRAFFDNLDAGICDVWWPDLDEDAIEAPDAKGGGKSASAAEKPPPLISKTWIELRFVDMAGQPMAGERYAIRVPGGELREGRLDASGCARLQGLDPGDCQVTFPDLDQGAWELA